MHLLLCILTALSLMTLPKEKLEKPVLMGSRIMDVNRPGGKVFAPGQRNPLPVLMHFEYDGAATVTLIPEGPGRGKKLKGAQKTAHPVHFPVAAVGEDGSLVLDMGGYFSSYPKQISAIPPKMLEKEDQLSGEILKVTQTPDYFELICRYSYTGGLKVTASCYILFLPEEPMPVRLVDPSSAGYNGEGFSHRWDLSRRNSIVFYVDKAFPSGWYPYIKEGLEDWNKAFDQAGLGRPISVLPEPEGLDRYSPLVNMVRYMDVEEANAKGDVLVDPRSGEVLQGDILWWKNVSGLIQGWRYVQTGAADPSARQSEYPLEMMGPMIRHAACHEMGHVLGLSHNMGASWAYPADSLRSPSFTRKYGTCASVMDYARYNHLATAKDIADGVGLLPPRLGPYDYYAIACGYASAAPKAGKYCYFAPFLSAAISPDPSAQPESLGNDLLLSSASGINNCKALLELDGLTPERLELLRKYYYRYIFLSLSNIGGTVCGKAVSKKLRRQTLEFVFDALDNVPPQLADVKQHRRVLEELEGNFLPERIEKTTGKCSLKSYCRTLRKLKKDYNF